MTYLCYNKKKQNICSRSEREETNMDHKKWHAISSVMMIVFWAICIISGHKMAQEKHKRETR